MSHFFSRLFDRISPNRASRVVDSNYVSDYTHFIDRFVDEHPEVKEDQHDGRMLYWDKQVDLIAQEKAEKDSVPDDGYGFRYSTWASSKPTPSADKGGKGWPGGH